MDEKITDGYGDEKMALIVLSDALPASPYFPGEEGQPFPATHDQHKKAVQVIS